MITIESLHKYYGSKKVLTDINLTFQTGEISGVVGRNGAGKTTLFKCITGLENYDGKISHSSGAIREVVGFLPTDPYFLSKITGREYLQLLCNARKIRVDDLDEKNIFDLPLDQYAEIYSTGMKKKLALMAILLQKNEIYILDEPFNGVDIQSNMIIQNILLKLKAQGKTIIISSHIFSALSEVCDMMFHIEEGVIKNSGRKEAFNQIEKEMRGSLPDDRIDQLID